MNDGKIFFLEVGRNIYKKLFDIFFFTNLNSGWAKHRFNYCYMQEKVFAMLSVKMDWGVSGGCDCEIQKSEQILKNQQYLNTKIEKMQHLVPPSRFL